MLYLTLQHSDRIGNLPRSTKVRRRRPGERRRARPALSSYVRSHGHQRELTSLPGNHLLFDGRRLL